ncbi:MAG: CYTH domain-containing protein [Sneathiella sp.]
MEIERKFLVTDDRWRSSVQKSEKIVQFYLTDETQHPTVRLRIKEGTGLLTIKYPSVSSTVLAREEFEYFIPVADIVAQQHLAKGKIIKKTRHHVLGPDNHIWEVDVFESPNTNLVLAEIELKTLDEEIDLPVWIAKEVTNDSQYRNLTMAFS